MWDPNVTPPGKSIGSALLFLLHMMSKMHPAPKQGGEGSKIAIVFNGSPLFAGEPGPSESNNPAPARRKRATPHCSRDG
jgi:hypothetical protein